MNKATHDRYLELIVAYQDGNLSEQELAELDHAIQSDDEIRALFIATQKRSLYLIELQRRQELVASDDTVKVSNPFTHQRFRLVALAASLLLVIGLIYLWQRETSPLSTPQSDSPILAHIVYDHGATWKNNAGSPKRQLHQGIIELSAGLARLKFVRGAEVTLQGPAALELLSDNSAHLRHGQLTAQVPKTAAGFTVVTPALDVVDRGTVFGLIVSEHSPTDVQVFEGAVELRPATKPSMSLSEGEAIHYSPENQLITKVDFNAKAYDGMWPTAHGITALTDAFRVMPPSPPWDLSNHYDDHHIIIIPEGRSLLLEKELKVNQTSTGAVTKQEEKQVIPAGTKLRSYLLQFNATPIEDPELTVLTGTVTFDQPILGVMWTTPHLVHGDSFLGAPKIVYQNITNRGLEIGNEKTKDKLSIAEDRRSLDIKIACSGLLDQVRVLVADE